MKFSRIKITPLFLAMLLLSISTKAESKVSLYGDAQLTHITYSATFDKNNPLYFSTAGNPDDERISLHGSSFVQSYSAGIVATNLTKKNQDQFYSLMIGYNWSQFNTKATENDSTTTYKGATGNFNINGRAAYATPDLPIKLTLLAYNSQTNSVSNNIFPNELIGDSMASGTTEGSKVSGWGGTFLFEPERASNVTLRGLPRLYIDYVERDTVCPDQTSDRLRELAVAGLSKENNWLTYRFLQYEHNDLSTVSGFNEQAIQIGLVDYRKKRKWSALTNWINISADGQLSSRNTLVSGSTTEEYDVNFFAIATRRTWNISTFLNYNRVTNHGPGSPDRSVEKYSIPVYVKGIWGRETDWFFRVSSADSMEKEDGLRKPTVSSSSISLGGTTFKRSSFTFSPTLSFNSYKSDTGVDYYDAALSLETRSSNRFSNKWYLTASSGSRYKDDGSADGISWNQSLLFRAFYRSDSPYTFGFSEDMQFGGGKDFISMGNRTSTGASGNTIGSSTASRGNGIADYVRSITTASFAWNKSASFSTTLDGSYDLVSNSSSLDSIADLKHRLIYTKNNSSFRMDTKYQRRDADGATSSEFNNTGLVQYRPDSRNEGVLSYSYSQNTNKDYTTSGYDLTQRYSLKFFTRAGVIRNLATLTEEFSYHSDSQNNWNYSLNLSGRYYPTAKTSLYASVKSIRGPEVLTLYYNAGASADFKLLSTSIDYSLGKRDIDHRTDQRIATTIRRSF